MKRSLFIIVLLLAALSVTYSFAANDNSSLLPSMFAGWSRAEVKTSQNPAVADPTNAALLKEDGFKDFEQAQYTRAGRTITVKAARFKDATGAYSAFTVYKQPGMTTVDMGGSPGHSLGAVLNDHVLFYRDNLLVQVTLDRITAMTAGELRELASLLPEAKGPAANLPILPTYLPKQSYIKHSAKYVIGPTGLSQIGSPISAQAVGFDEGAEVATGKYDTSRGTATLMLISYPTPAIAGERMRKIEAMNQHPPAAAEPDLSAPFFVKRTGPMVVMAAGSIPADQAKSLLASVNYDADVTWNQNTHFDKKDNMANLLVNIVVLIGILIVLALGFGIAFGGVRLLLKRLMPGRVFDRPETMEIIQLKIESGQRRAASK